MKKTALAVCVGALLAGVSLSSQACFTVIVGKDASATGEIIIGHNEDNDRRIITNQYWVPAADHKADEMIEFEPAAAKIPQVAHTYGFWWTQTLAPEGSSFSDGFMNENGVVVVTNNCNITIEEKEKFNDGGIGYGIRRLVAERATSARHGVDIVIELMEKYGYFHMGRTYTIADKNEAWQIALLRGHRYLARKVKDNEIAFMANAFSLDNVDLNDKENVIAAPDLVEHAIAMGAYKPAVAGDYSDFSFREAYQPEARRIFPRNKERVFTILEMLTGKEYKDVNDYPMAIVPEKKISVEDVKSYLRGHSKFEKRESGWHHETQFYAPAFPLAGPAAAQSYMDWATGTKAQFHATPEQVSYSPDRTIYTFLAMQNFLDWMPQDRAVFEKDRVEYEENTAKVVAAAKAKAQLIAGADREKAREYMHAFNVASFNDVLAKTGDWVTRLNQHAIVITRDTLSQSETGTVDVALLSQKGFDATKLDVSKTHFGSPYPDGSIELNKQMATPTKVTVRDVNGDGLDDAVITFPVKGALAFSFKDVVSELYLFTSVNGEPVAAFDTVKVIK